jgi:rare lipoprotein A
MKGMWFAMVITIISCSSATTVRPEPVFQQVGLASYYARKFHGRRTASGERYNENTYTAAHASLAFGSRVIVRNLKNNLTVTVRINDRGPFIKGRIIDLSLAAARDLKMVRDGVAKVHVRLLR